MELSSAKCSFAKKASSVSAIVLLLALGALLLLAGRTWSKSRSHSPDNGIDIHGRMNGELPFLTLSGGSAGAKIKPERLPPPANGSDIYISVLTAPVYHDKRFAVQYLTWMQTVDLKNVRLITDSEDNRWVQAFKKEGGTVVTPDCQLSKITKSVEMMCCKSGAQFDYWYRAREAGHNYKWYCHVDDDIYLNINTLVETLKHYDHTRDCYIGNWKVLERAHKHRLVNSRIPASKLAPGLLTYDNRKRDDFRYANGPSYCISEALMMKVEKYLRGKNYEDHCRKSQVDMDDILPGVIIDAVLGIDINETAVLKGQLDDIMYYSSNNPEELKRVKREATIGFTGFVIKYGTFNYLEDPYGVFSYHCLLHPEVSWCNQRQRSRVYK